MYDIREMQKKALINEKMDDIREMQKRPQSMNDRCTIFAKCKKNLINGKMDDIREM